ncbi:DUF2970 domain-containing protein [Ottowia sp. VDI28]|uniref:DUF2970 domain-containing protein n=1 Tax=Ottowia sp. VDI28 TaxID=3133968 RepID=UPI003C2F703B
MSILKQIKTVLWSLIGIGRRQDMEDIPERGSPIVLLLVALVMVLVLVGTLAFVAHTVAG